MALDMFDLTGKVAMVTGGTRGLGEVCATALAKAGADVAVCGRNVGRPASGSRKRSAPWVGRARSSAIDVTDKER